MKNNLLILFSLLLVFSFRAEANPGKGIYSFPELGKFKVVSKASNMKVPEMNKTTCVKENELKKHKENLEKTLQDTNCKLTVTLETSTELVTKTECNSEELGRSVGGSHQKIVAKNVEEAVVTFRSEAMGGAKGETRVTRTYLGPCK